jgi:hypothetical protein
MKNTTLEFSGYGLVRWGWVVGTAVKASFVVHVVAALVAVLTT